MPAMAACTSSLPADTPRRWYLLSLIGVAKILIGITFVILPPISKVISISIVNYTNTLPFRWALKRSPLLEQIDLQEDIPSQCAQKLRNKQVDLALVPVALLGELKEFSINTKYCIGADGIVDSVKLYHDVPLKDI